MAATGSLEHEIQRVGRELADSFPSPIRHPVKALDDKAMDLASRDAELRAALFRFVDVVPACRSLEDLARHLSAFLHEVDERPPPLDAAMRMADSKAGARALGLAAAAGVRHMAHRFIVGETPRRRAAAAARPLAATASRPRSTCSERRRSRSRRPTATPSVAAAALAHARTRRPRGGRSGRTLERDSIGAIPRVNLSVKVSALTPLLRPEAPEVGKARRRRPPARA